MEVIFEQSFEYLSVIAAPIFCLTIVALADEIFYLVRRSVTAAKTRRRYR